MSEQMAVTAHTDCAILTLRQAQAEWASEYDRVTREHPGKKKARAALRMASELAGRRADALSVPPTEHDCEACEDCIHNGNKCCGCYDGACCREVVLPSEQQAPR